MLDFCTCTISNVYNRQQSFQPQLAAYLTPTNIPPPATCSFLGMHCCFCHPHLHAFLPRRSCTFL